MCLCVCGAALVRMSPDTGSAVVYQLWFIFHYLWVFSCHFVFVSDFGPICALGWGCGEGQVRECRKVLLFCLKHLEFQLLTLSQMRKPFEKQDAHLSRTGVGVHIRTHWRIGCTLPPCIAGRESVSHPFLVSLITGFYSVGCLSVSASHPWSCLKGPPSHLMRHSNWKALATGSPKCTPQIH